MVDDETHGVEISIAGGGEEIVRAHPLGGFVFFVLIIVNCLRVQTRMQR